MATGAYARVGGDYFLGAVSAEANFVHGLKQRTEGDMATIKLSVR